MSRLKSVILWSVIIAFEASWYPTGVPTAGAQTKDEYVWCWAGTADDVTDYFTAVFKTSGSQADPIKDDFFKYLRRSYPEVQNKHGFVDPRCRLSGNSEDAARDSRQNYWDYVKDRGIEVIDTGWTYSK